MDSQEYSENTALLEKTTLLELENAGWAQLVRLWKMRILTPSAWAMHVCSVTGWPPSQVLGPQPEAGAAKIFQRILSLLAGDQPTTNPNLNEALKLELDAHVLREGDPTPSSLSLDGWSLPFRTAHDTPPSPLTPVSSSWKTKQLSGELVARLASLQNQMESLVQDARSTAEHCAVTAARMLQEDATFPEAPPPLSGRGRRAERPTPRLGVGADSAHWEENRRKLLEMFERAPQTEE